MLVAFQGERGAYSEDAVRFYFGDVEVLPCPTIVDVFKVVESRRAEYGIVPIENSLEGSVNETYDMLLETKLRIRGEIKLRIRHCLIGNPESKLADIRLVYSHPQALAQCRRSIKRLNLKPMAYYDTAGSVKMIKESGVVDAAAIASKRAVEFYEMKVLLEGIEDSKANYTRFLVLHPEDAPKSGRDKTSVIFSVRHVPGALYGALEVFARRGINLTKIESRPVKKTPWEYNFYVDFEGHREDEEVREAIGELALNALFVKVLGSYRRAE